MKFNISYPQTGQQKCIEIDDEKQYRVFYDKRMGQEVDGEVLGDQFKGYVFRISGGNDKQGFPMKQGILCNTRVRVLMKAGHSCYRPRRTGERKRKSVRGCIIGPDIRVLALVVVKKGEDEIEGLTNETRPRRLGPKRATRIRKLFGLEKPKKGEDGKPDPKPDEVRHFVIRREITKEGAKSRWKAPKIQRLVTPQRLRRKRVEVALKKTRKEATKKKLDEYKKLVATYHKQKKEDKKNEQKEDKKVTKETARPQTQKS